MNASLTFVSPTYAKDLQRFALLRESMERCDIDIPHMAVVQHEDLPLFQKIPFRHKLTLLSSRDVLPPEIEARRTATSYGRRHPYRWLKPRPLHGWITQQLMKLSAPQYVPTEGIVCLDSDVVFVDRVEEHEFYGPDRRLHLYESDRDFTVGTIQWMAQSMQAFKIPLEHKPLLYIHHPVPLHRQVVLGLQRGLERIHGRRWSDVFLDLNLTEYTSYGVYARFVNDLKHVTPVKPPFTLSFWNDEQLEGYTETLLDRIRARGAKVVCINSGIGRPVDEYRSLVEKAWSAGGRRT
jgi:hypothetical protein